VNLKFWAIFAKWMMPTASAGEESIIFSVKKHDINAGDLVRILNDFQE
jgi:uncharacterized membrane protein